jgi:AcrR family transcriptional regulator
MATRPISGAGTTSRSEGTRRAILEAAFELYSRSGFRGTGLTAIGERVGVTHAAVLYHFGTAKQLLAAVLEERTRQFYEQTAPAWAPGGLAAIANLPVVARFNVADPNLARLFTVLTAENLDPAAELHDHFRSRRRALHTLLVDLIGEAVAAGDARADVDAAAVADEMIAFMDGAQLQWLLDPERVDLVDLYERYTDALVPRLAYSPPSL